MDGRLCRRCNQDGPFYKSYADHHNYVCKACASSLVAESRKMEPARLLAYRWYNSLRHRGIHCLQLGAAVAEVLILWGPCSVIGGETSIDQLCIFPFFRDVPCQESWHWVIVSQREARSLSHTRSEDKVHSMFPQHVRQRMLDARQERQGGKTTN